MKRVTSTVGLAAALVVMAPAPAEADCVGAEAQLRRTGEAPVTVLAAGTCLFPTPWPEWVRAHVDQGVSGLPPGTPNGVHTSVWVVMP